MSVKWDEVGARSTVCSKSLEMTNFPTWCPYGTAINEARADVNAQREDHQTPLHVESYHGKLEIARVLLDRGAKVDVVDDNDLTHCTRHRSLRRSWRWGCTEHGTDVIAKSDFGETPLDMASHSTRPKLAERLLKHAANVDAQRPTASSSRAD